MPCQRRPFHARLISNSRVTAADHWQDVRLVQFDIKGSGMRYKIILQFIETLIVGLITSCCLGQDQARENGGNQTQEIS